MTASGGTLDGEVSFALKLGTALDARMGMMRDERIRLDVDDHLNMAILSPEWSMRVYHRRVNPDRPREPYPTPCAWASPFEASLIAAQGAQVVKGRRLSIAYLVRLRTSSRLGCTPSVQVCGFAPRFFHNPSPIAPQENHPMAHSPPTVFSFFL